MQLGMMRRTRPVTHDAQIHWLTHETVVKRRMICSVRHVLHNWALALQWRCTSHAVRCMTCDALPLVHALADDARCEMHHRIPWHTEPYVNDLSAGAHLLGSRSRRRGTLVG